MQAVLEKIRSFFQMFLTFLNMVNDEALVTRVHIPKMCIDVFYRSPQICLGYGDCIEQRRCKENCKAIVGDKKKETMFKHPNFFGITSC
jgi:hypothetical protein